MDGNGRWAAKRGLPRPAGHKAGVDNLRKIMDACRNRGIKYATFFAFSTENWKRPKEEVDALMRLFYDYLDEADRFTGKKARIMFLGSKEPFPEKLRERMIKLEQNSVGYDSMTIMFAMNYGGRDDIVYAARRLAEAAAEKLHEFIRKKAWGYAPDEQLTMKQLLNEDYQGIRPAVGYPSLPDISVSYLLDELIDMKRIGIHLTENGMMQPHASVCGLMFSHPASRYFAVGKIDEEQLKDYAERRGFSVKEMRKYLSANLQD